MIPALLGKKIGMTQIYDDKGQICPVTIIQAGPCVVMQVKNTDTDGYHAVQLGYQDVKPQRASKPSIGHAATAGTGPKKFVREIRHHEACDEERGAVVDVSVFEDNAVKYVDVYGTTKGRGFSGGMRRYGFGGQTASHGVERKHRSPGSISSHSSDLGHGGNVKKGKRMAGQYGNVRSTARNQELVKVDKENHLLLVRGSVPGPNGAFVVVRSAKTRS